ncbi:MAG: PCRF domain-containing protein, partial [Anaerolineales bacterium]
MKKFKTLTREFKNSRRVFDLAGKNKKIDELEKLSEASDFWNDPQSAKSIMKKMAVLRSEVESWGQLQSRIKDALELSQMEDESLIPELEREIQDIERELGRREFNAMLPGKYDSGDALLAIHAGAGGTDSQDWVEMLQRMYLRWAEAHGFDTEILDMTEGEEAGIKSVTISVNGDYAYGYLRPEKGVHRLVRLSPFDSSHRRHTSFALIEVLPQVEEKPQATEGVYV